MILRDIDLLKQFNKCEAGITITTLDDKIRKEIEPNTACVEKRVNALKELKSNSLKTYVFIGPILPYITDWKNIVENTKSFADYYMFENLNISGSIWQSIRKWLSQGHNELLNKYEKIYFTSNQYWDNVEKEILIFCRQNGIDGRIYFHHKA